MSVPNVPAAPGDDTDTLFVEESPSVSTSEQPSFEDRVTSAIGEMTQSDEGKWVFPEGTPPEVQYAALTEKRRRDTQSALAKEQQQRVAAESKAKALEEQILNGDINLDLSPEQVQELEDLKEHDPEAWRKKLQSYETEIRTKRKQVLEEAGYTAEGVAETERRAQVLTDFLASNPGLVLNDEVFENDLPPRITGKLERGEVSFEEFLDEAKEFLSASKKVQATEEEEEPRLSEGGGGANIKTVLKEQSESAAYENSVF